MVLITLWICWDKQVKNDVKIRAGIAFRPEDQFSGYCNRENLAVITVSSTGFVIGE